MLKEKTVVELKEMLKERGLIVSGRKAELIERIEQFDQAVNEYNENAENLINGHGAMYDYINRNITVEVIGATGGDFIRSRIEDVVKADSGLDIIRYMVEDVESLLDFYMEGGNEHTKSEIAEVRQFLNFLKNLASHVEVKAVGGEASEPIESVEEVNEDDSDVPAQEPSLVSKPITTFEGRTTLGKFVKIGIASKQYTVIHSDGYDYLMFNDQLCASEGYDSVTAVAKDGEIVKVYRLSSRGVSETCFEGDELHRL